MVLFFRRSIDDCFIVAQGKSKDADIIILLRRTLDPNIRITQAVSDTSAVGLDTCIYKGDRFEETGIRSSRVYQKEMYLAHYLPTHAAHSGEVFRNIISGEGCRYLIPSSDIMSLVEVASKCYFRLR